MFNVSPFTSANHRTQPSPSSMDEPMFERIVWKTAGAVIYRAGSEACVVKCFCSGADFRIRKSLMKWKSFSCSSSLLMVKSKTVVYRSGGGSVTCFETCIVESARCVTRAKLYRFRRGLGFTIGNTSLTHVGISRLLSKGRECLGSNINAQARIRSLRSFLKTFQGIFNLTLELFVVQTLSF